MPRPPILPVIDWRAVFAAGRTYADWLSIAEDPKNVEKMETRRREIKLHPAVEPLLAALPRPVHVVAIAEDWCGDVHRHVPVLQKLAEFAPILQIRYIARADRPDIFVRYLTNGGEAIPKFVFLNDQFVEIGNWGAMPEEARRLIARGKGAGDVASARKRVSALYEFDPHGEIVVRELLAHIENATCAIP